MHYHPITSSDKQQILREIGVASLDNLIEGIPRELRYPKIAVPAGLSELEIQNELQKLFASSKQKSFSSFLGAGMYDHFVPSAVAQIVSRNEFYTAYTPYQPEASQGTLQAIFEYQSLIAELTGMDVSNASHYDGATSMSEAALMALRHTDRKVILVSRAIHPHYRDTLKTYLKGTHFQVREIGFEAHGGFSRDDFQKELTENIAGAIFQTPNFFGVVEDLEGISQSLHQLGALLISVVNPLSLGVYKTPGEWGADIAVGEGQPLGIRPQFGGPALGFIATTKALMRKIPGRLVGVSRDSEDRRAYVLTLTAREQHIRRERASSNICTNQGLCALTACVYMTLMGRQGIQLVSELNVDRSTYLRQGIQNIKGFQVDTKTPIFNEFVVKSSKPMVDLQKKMENAGILPGVSMEPFYPELKNQFLVCATETKTQADLDQYLKALESC